MVVKLFSNRELDDPVFATVSGPVLVSPLDRVPNEVLQLILDFAMSRDSPLYLDTARIYIRPAPRSPYITRRYGPCTVTSSTGPQEINLTVAVDGDKPSHQYTPQSVHRADWMIINHTCRRIRHLGKRCFFRSKSIVMNSDVLSRLRRSDFQRILPAPDDQALALSCIREVVLIDPKQAAPNWYFNLPRYLAALPALRRCTLLYGYDVKEWHVEFVTAAVALGGPIPATMRDHMVAAGLPGHLELLEAIGPMTTWAIHQTTIEKWVYPVLKLRANIMRAKTLAEETVR